MGAPRLNKARSDYGTTDREIHSRLQNSNIEKNLEVVCISDNSSLKNQVQEIKIPFENNPFHHIYGELNIKAYKMSHDALLIHKGTLIEHEFRGTNLFSSFFIVIDY